MSNRITGNLTHLSVTPMPGPDQFGNTFRVVLGVGNRFAEFAARGQLPLLRMHDGRMAQVQLGDWVDLFVKPGNRYLDWSNSRLCNGYTAPVAVKPTVPAPTLRRKNHVFLTDAQVDDVVAQYNRRVPTASIAAHYRVSESTIRRYLRERAGLN